MNTIRIAAACAVVALVSVQSWGQDKAATSQAEPVAQDVGGVADTSKGETGQSMVSTRQFGEAFSHLPQAADQTRMPSSLFSHH